MWAYIPTQVDTSQPAEVMGSGFVTGVIAVWQPGEEGGNALAALLWGDVDFSSALAVTAYRQAFTGARGPSHPHSTMDHNIAVLLYYVICHHPVEHRRVGSRIITTWFVVLCCRHC